MPKKKTAEYEITITRKQIKKLIDMEAMVGEGDAKVSLEIPKNASVDVGEKPKTYDQLTGYDSKKYRGSGPKRHDEKTFITVSWQEEEEV
jgi:hypothetical protein